MILVLKHGIRKFITEQIGANNMKTQKQRINFVVLYYGYSVRNKCEVRVAREAIKDMIESGLLCVLGGNHA